MKYTFKDICTKIGSGATPTGGKEAYKGGDYALVRSQNVLDYTFTTSGLAYINETQAKKLDGVKVEVGDVLLNITGDSVARACIIPDEILPARVNQHVAIIRANNQYALNEYLLYFLQYNKQYLLSISQGGGTRNAITKKMIEDIEIDLPSIEDQTAIVNIINSISKKIEINQQINDKLEQQAKTLYKSWFVDFEPFKDGNFVESEIGDIPAGWSIVKFGDITEIAKKTINPQKFPDSTFYHYSLPACDNGLIPEIQAGKDIMSNKIILQNNITLFSKLNPRIKRIWFTCEVLPNSICSTEFIPFRAKDDNESSYIFSIVNSDAFYATVMGCVNGATGSHQRFHAEDTEDFLCPYNKDAVNEFSKLIEPILSQMHDLRHENVMLASTRDTLLPRLMSGELKINEIDC